VLRDYFLGELLLTHTCHGFAGGSWSRPGTHGNTRPRVNTSARMECGRGSEGIPASSRNNRRFREVLPPHKPLHRHFTSLSYHGSPRARGPAIAGVFSTWAAPAHGSIAAKCWCWLDHWLVPAANPRREHRRPPDDLRVHADQPAGYRNVGEPETSLHGRGDCKITLPES